MLPGQRLVRPTRARAWRRARHHFAAASAVAEGSAATVAWCVLVLGCVKAHCQGSHSTTFEDEMCRDGDGHVTTELQDKGVNDIGVQSHLHERGIQGKLLVRHIDDVHDDARNGPIQPAQPVMTGTIVAHASCARVVLRKAAAAFATVACQACPGVGAATAKSTPPAIAAAAAAAAVEPVLWPQ